MISLSWKVPVALLAVLNLQLESNDQMLWFAKLRKRVGVSHDHSISKLVVRSSQEAANHHIKPRPFARILTNCIEGYRGRGATQKGTAYHETNHRGFLNCHSCSGTNADFGCRAASEH